MKNILPQIGLVTLLTNCNASVIIDASENEGVGGTPTFELVGGNQGTGGAGGSEPICNYVCTGNACVFQDSFDELDEECNWNITAGNPYVAESRLVLEGIPLLETKETLPLAENFYLEMKLEESPQNNTYRVDFNEENIIFSTTQDQESKIGYVCDGTDAYLPLDDFSMPLTVKFQRNQENVELYLNGELVNSIPCSKPSAGAKVYLGSTVGLPIPHQFKIDSLEILLSQD